MKTIQYKKFRKKKIACHTNNSFAYINSVEYSTNVAIAKNSNQYIIYWFTLEFTHLIVIRKFNYC